MSGPVKFSEQFYMALVRVEGFVTKAEAEEEGSESFSDITDTATLAIRAGLGWYVGGNPTQCHCGTVRGTGRCIGRAMWGSLVCHIHYATLFPRGRHSSRSSESD